MSTHIEWVPAIRNGHIVDEDRGLKWALQEEYGYPVQVTLSNGNIDFLKGLKAGGVKGSDKLIKAIEKHGAIRVYETE